MNLVFTQVWGYAKVWVLGRFWLRLGPRFGGAADPGFTPRSRGFGANPENFPPGPFFYLVPPLSATLSRPLAIEPPALDLQRGELVVEVGERGVEVRIVRRRAAVDRHEVGEVAPPGPARDSGLSPVPRLCGRGEARFTTDSQVREIRDLTR